MEFQDVVRKRRMVRSFLDRPLPRGVVSRLLRNAQRAPSAGYSQGWAFLVFEGADETARYWAAVGPDDREEFQWPDLYNAPLLIVCLSHKDVYLDRYAEADKGWFDRSEARWPAPYWDIDTGMAAMLILLTAVDEGLGALFFGIPVAKMTRFHERFGVPAGFRPIGTVAVGYPKEGDRPSLSLGRGRRPSEQVVHRGGRW
ncbi:MAG: nitroreductase family protein [Chloroflexota bacterium]|nr:nitroreductase family protein [Chloroflexota bacterium]